MYTEMLGPFTEEEFVGHTFLIDFYSFLWCKVAHL